MGTLAPDGHGGWGLLPAATELRLLDVVQTSGVADHLLERQWLELLAVLSAPGRLV